MASTLANNNEIRVRFTGRMDKNGAEFYVAHTKIPMLVDLNETSLLFFPDETDRGFGGDLIIRRQDNKVAPRKPAPEPEEKTTNEE
jgi:hypothetical protein